jgi:hypothetical protein
MQHKRVNCSAKSRDRIVYYSSDWSERFQYIYFHHLPLILCQGYTILYLLYRSFFFSFFQDVVTGLKIVGTYHILHE